MFQCFQATTGSILSDDEMRRDMQKTKKGIKLAHDLSDDEEDEAEKAKRKEEELEMKREEERERIAAAKERAMEAKELKMMREQEKQIQRERDKIQKMIENGEAIKLMEEKLKKAAMNQTAEESRMNSLTGQIEKMKREVLEVLKKSSLYTKTEEKQASVLMKGLNEEDKCKLRLLNNKLRISRKDLAACMSQIELHFSRQSEAINMISNIKASESFDYSTGRMDPDKLRRLTNMIVEQYEHHGGVAEEIEFVQSVVAQHTQQQITEEDERELDELLRFDTDTPVQETMVIKEPDTLEDLMEEPLDDHSANDPPNGNVALQFSAVPTNDEVDIFSVVAGGPKVPTTNPAGKKEETRKAVAAF